MKEQTPEELKAAVKKYEAELVPRGNEAVMASYMNTNAVHDWSTMMSSPLFTEGLAKDKKKAEDDAIAAAAAAAAEVVGAEAA